MNIQSIHSRGLWKKVNQKVTLKFFEHAGHSIWRSPGRRFIRSWRSHPGHDISTRGVCGVSVKWVEQDAHCRCAGLLFTPATRTFPHSGHPSFSSLHFLRVTGWSTRTRALQSLQVSSPNSFGSKPLHLGQESAGGEIRDSTVSSSPIYIAPVLCSWGVCFSVMELLFLRNQSNARWKEIPRQVKFDSVLLC